MESTPAAYGEKEAGFMTNNKSTVERYMEGFNKSDHEQILSCLTDDVVWEMPGQFHLVGKDAFDKEIENDVVVAEGNVRCARRGGSFLNAVFCDVFVMRDAKINHLTSYMMEVKG